jgi:hypothetical protein
MSANYEFKMVDVKTEVVSKLKRELPKFNYATVKVVRADPQTASEIPCIGINRVDDSESESSIGNFDDTSMDNSLNIVYTNFGTFFRESLEVRIWHTNADERDKLYVTTKAILFALRLELTEAGLLNIELRSGRDEQDTSMQHAPMAIYWASITMSYLNPLDVTVKQNATVITGVQSNFTISE